MTLKELILAKEELEDLIAEKEREMFVKLDPPCALDRFDQRFARDQLHLGVAAPGYRGGGGKKLAAAS